MTKLSNYQQLKNKFMEVEQKYKNTILPYQQALENIKRQYRSIDNALKIMYEQKENKRKKVINILEAQENKGTFFTGKKYSYFSSDYKYFSDNYGKIYKEYEEIKTYLSLKVIFLNCQIDYIAINAVSEIAYIHSSLYGYFNIADLKYKKYEFIYKLLKDRNLDIKQEYDKYYSIYNYKYSDSSNYPYKAFYSLYNIIVPCYLLEKDKHSKIREDKNFYPFKIKVVPADKICIIMNRFLQQIKFYSLKLRELEELKKQAKYIINCSDSNVYYNTFLDGYIIKEICEEYSSNNKLIKDIALKYRSV